MNNAWQKALQLIQSTNHIVVMQPENVDGDSLGSALALEEILGDMGKKVSLYCAVDMPRYLHYFAGWDRVEKDFPPDAGLCIVVDNSVQTLLEKALSPERVAILARTPLLVFDHHGEFQEADLLSTRFAHTHTINETYAATAELLADWAIQADLPLNERAATHLVSAILSDSLGLTVESVTPRTMRLVAQLMERGASLPRIDRARRELMKKTPEILHYKGELLQRIEYFAGGQLAVVHIPWPEIEKYSDRYNPSVLVIDEMRLVEGVRVAVSFKTYPDGKVTAKIRATVPIGDKLAAHFKGGGHPMAAGFKRYTDDYIGLKKELIATAQKLLQEFDANAHHEEEHRETL